MISKFVLEHWEILVALLTATLTLIGVIRARLSREDFADSRREESGFYQLDKAYGEVERVLREEFKVADSKTSLQRVLDRGLGELDHEEAKEQLAVLSHRFVAYAEELHKYFENFVDGEAFSFKFQRHSKDARRVVKLFNAFKYEDFYLEVAVHHLNEARIL